MFSSIFNTILYIPILNIFISIYNIIPDLGVVIIIVTLLLKFALYPTTAKSIKAQKSMTDIQPELEKVKEKHKGNQQMIAQETMALYKKHKVNPLGSCLPLLIQIPVFLALYWVLRDGIAESNFDKLYSFVQAPEHLNTMFLGYFDLAKPQIFIAVLAAASQYFQSKMFLSQKKKDPNKKEEDNMMSNMGKQMTIMMPMITLIIGTQLPGGLLLYWLFSTLFTIGQQKYLFAKQESKTGVIEGTIID